MLLPMTPPGFITSSSSSGCRPTAGFSLIELLVTVALISLLATLVSPALSSVLGGRNVARALDVVSSTAAVARQMAMTKGNPIAMVVSQSSHSTPDDNPAVMLLSAPEISTDPWAPVGAWTKVPTNVQLDVYLRDGKKSFFAGGEGPLLAPLPLKLNGKSVSEYDYIVFYPDGSVNAPANGPALTFRRLNKTDTATEYTMVVQSNSGRTKIIQ